ncbi:carbon storage regulator [Acutalibacter caecimuris]|uniref:carbon storage regulator n=1 Tax=Acutalibacter caecimuris TaxID=3093657 RepID=UPI002AC958E3|nr:carbon storage regulator [Acutalibacter sp. M00118]
MLSLRLKSGEYFTVGEDVVVQVFRQKGDSIEVAVTAPREVTILRGELLEVTEKRPEGLREKDYKRRSEVAHNAKRMENIERKRTERAAACRQVADILDKMESNAPQLQGEIAAIRQQMTVFQ